jgi:acyl carrier protein
MRTDLNPVIDELTLLLRDVFDNDKLVASPELTARDVEGWDSLGNVRLFMEIERKFHIRFTAPEIGLLKNVGQLAEAILRKSAQTS